MEKRNVLMSIGDARFLYNTCDSSTKKIILKYFTKEELEQAFNEIRTFKDACNALKLDYDRMVHQSICIGSVSKASAAMFKLNIIRKALNLGYDMSLTENTDDFYVYYPHNPFISKASTYYKKEIKSGEMKVIGKFKCDDKEYSVLCGRSYHGGSDGIGYFNPSNGVGDASATFGFLGCARKEIAHHFGKYFGMLITESKYGDMKGFEIIK